MNYLLDCNRNGTTIYNPVCGTDNKSYYNEGLLRQTACAAASSLSVLYNGKCGGKQINIFLIIHI